MASFSSSAFSTSAFSESAFSFGVAAAADNPRNMPLLAPADWRSADDQAFEAYARVATLAEDLEDLERFIDEVEAAGDEFVDPQESSIDDDVELLGVRRRGRRWIN